MGRRLLILFLMLATAVTTGAIAVGVSNDLVTNCDEGHTWEDSSVLVEADCTTEGVLLQECSVCGEKQEVAIDATGHEYGEFTSNGNGTHSKVCANDDDHVVTENCSGGEATCTEKATCSVCGEKYGAELLHTYNVEKATAEYLKEEATCVTKAQYYYSCECGEKGARWFEYGEYAPHVYEYEIAEPEHLKTPADCSHDAVYYLSCACTASGDDAYTFVAVGTMGGHNFLNTTVKDATTLVSEATCTEHAIYKYTCTGCDAIGTETYEGEILNHEMTYHAAVEATCKVEGFVEYWACATCSKNYDAEQGGTEIENVSLGLNANNHKNVVVTKEAQASTCTVAGWTKEETCNDCNVVVTVSEALELASHSEVTTTENEVEATCTTAGSYDTVVTCSVCTTELSRVNTVVDALGHECSTTEANTCVRCDKVFTVAEIVEMAQGLANDTALTGKYELTGVITKIDTEASTYYQNVSVIIEVENGDNDLSILCFRLKGEGYDVIAVGDNITVEGIIKNYNGTIEFDAGCVIVSSLHTITLGEIDTTKGNATLSVNEQVALGTTVDVEIDLVKGYAVESVLVNGVAVTTYEGNVFSFVVEKSSTVVVNFKEAGAESETPESTATLTFDSDKENRTEYSTEKQVWSQNGVTLTNNKANSTNNVGDYTAPGRFYKSSEVIISFTQKMTKIVIDASGASYATPYQASIQDYTVTVDGKMVTIDLGEGVESITFTTTAQVRANSITVYYVDENAAPAHTHVPGTAVEENRVEATCEAAGSYDEVVYCTDITCMGEISRETKAIEKKAHTEEIIPGKAATCIATGLTEGKKCSVCGEILLEQEEIGLVAHTPSAPVEENRVEATCEAAGSYDSVVYCSVDDCGYEISRTPNTIAKKEHTMTHYEAVTSTCQVAGNVEYWACSVCGKNYDAEQNGNVISDVNLGYGACVDVNPEDNKCDICDKTMCEHEWSAWTSVDAENHSRECLKPTCGKVEVVNHTEETLAAVAPDCTNTGLTEGKKCSVCDEVLVAQTVVDALGHDMVTDAAKAPTCTETGLTEGSHCSRCDGATTEQETIDALGHDVTYYAAVEAKCETAGNVEYWACANCSKNFDAEKDGKEIANVTISALGHKNDTLVEKVEATCSKEGMEAHYFCDVCDTYFDAEKNATTADALTIAINAEKHTMEGDKCSSCGGREVNKTLAIFEFGANGAASHYDGTKKDQYTETQGSYTLTLSDMSNVYIGARDLLGNSTIKLGTGSLTASFTFTVPTDVTKVVIYVATYKANSSTISINDVNYTLSSKSNDGQYDAIEINTTTAKTITLKSGVEDDKRCMINTIKFVSSSICIHDLVKVDEKNATCKEAGNVAYYNCKKCGTNYTDNTADVTIDNVVVEIDSDNHVNIVTLDAIAPKCNEVGKTEGKKCSDCGVITIAQIDIPVIDCQDVEPEDGNCDMCGASLSCEHVFDETPVKKDDTYHTIGCSKCDATTDVEHDFSGTITAGDSQHTIKCTACEATVLEDHIDEDSNGACDKCNASLAQFESTKYVFSSYATGTQYAEGEKHQLDDYTEMTINGAHLNTQVRLYAGSNAVFYNTAGVSSATIKAGNKAGTLTVYVSNDGETWIEIKAISTTTSYTEYSVDFGGKYNYVKLESTGAQIRVSELTLNP